MEKAIIFKNVNGDSRTAKSHVEYADFQLSNNMHIADVINTMKIITSRLEEAAKKHDNTKKSHEEIFYKQFKRAAFEGTNFTEESWYKMHVEKERHHLLSRCPEDVNLIDVIEMLVDCVCAAKTRTGYIRPIELDSDILQRAVKNTVTLLDENTIVK